MAQCILVIKSGLIKIFFKCVTNALSNSTNLLFFNERSQNENYLKTFVRHVNCHNDLRQTEKYLTKIYKFSQITEIYRIEDNIRMFFMIHKQHPRYPLMLSEEWTLKP